MSRLWRCDSHQFQLTQNRLCYSLAVLISLGNSFDIQSRAVTNKERAMKQFFPRIPFGTGNRMKRFMSRLDLRSPLALVLISFAVAATLLALAASASRKASRASDSPTNLSLSNTATKSASAKPLTRLANRNALTPMALMPFAPTITATLADDITLAAKKNPGDTITYTATISNTGSDAFNVVYTDPLDNNTTLVGGSINTT